MLKLNSLTKPTTRKYLRSCAKAMRSVFSVGQDGSFPVLEVLEKLPDVFPDTSIEVVEDYCLPPKDMAFCEIQKNGGYIIKIKESVYDGAYDLNNPNRGSLLGFICHEICHVFLFHLGYTPIKRTEEKVEAFKNVEWQAKALCGEVCIPYEESEEMTKKEIVKNYVVSKASADMRVKLKKKTDKLSANNLSVNISLKFTRAYMR